MKASTRVAYLGLGLGVWLTWTGGAIHAQVQGYQMDRSKTPGYSPYLNILRGGSTPAINYYGLVRPEIAFGNSLYQLGVEQNLLMGQQSQLSNQQSALAAYTTLPTTGHAAGFQTQSKYFMTGGAQGGQANNFAGGGMGAQPQNKGR